MSASTPSRAGLLLLAASHAPVCSGMIMTGRPGYGLVGYGIIMYDPVCPYACRGALSASPLNCSTTMMMDDAPMTETSTSCYANDNAFLASMAWCIKSRCNDMKPWEIEKWWNHEIPGKQVDQPDAKWTYQQTLDEIATPPTTMIASGDPLNTTMLLSDDDYALQAKTLAAFTKVEVNHSRYGLVLLISSVIIPIAASLLHFLPLPSTLNAKIYAFLVDRALVKPRRGWLYRMISPDLTRGQAIFVLYVLIINIVLCIAGYPVIYPNAWWTTRSQEILAYVANRAGVLSFANIPVLTLYAGRNNFLLWLTNWEHSTFMLLHSWVAFICTIEAVLHSIIYLRIYVHLGTHGSESQLPYWYWGIIATLGFSILLPGSISAFRKKLYEIFLASHFAIALLSLVGCYLHIFYKFEHQWGYELWIYIAFAIWGFDRLMRLLRMARHGVRTANITSIDEDYLRVDVEGLAGDGHVYLYFPTLTWRVWENHPFSVSTTFTKLWEGRSLNGSLDTKDVKTDPPRAHEDAEAKGGRVTMTTSRDESDLKVSMTFFIRICNGTTALLQHHQSLPVLVESGYPTSDAIPPASFLICIAGGVGITAVIPVLQMHRGRSRLLWSCRSKRLVEAVKPLIKDIEKDVVVGGRCDVQSVLAAEASGGAGEIMVLVSGPKGMMDDVREIVCGIAGQSSRPIRLHCESFSW